VAPPSDRGTQQDATDETHPLAFRETGIVVTGRGKLAIPYYPLRRPSGRPNFRRLEYTAVSVRPVRLTTSAADSVRSNSSSLAVHARPAAGGQVPRRRTASRNFAHLPRSSDLYGGIHPIAPATSSLLARGIFVGLLSRRLIPLPPPAPARSAACGVGLWRPASQADFRCRRLDRMATLMFWWGPPSHDGAPVRRAAVPRRLPAAKGFICRCSIRVRPSRFV
jgi:hypothetical protein